ncbi:MAG TPA: MBL fold metallo-hydrolase [Bryobacteraceae bacterium]|nr:MBL fold metallo-hydrolase [Bryobacteraceae bacterium]
MRFRALWLLAMAALGTIVMLVSGAMAEPEIVRIIAPGIWFRQGDSEQGHCNNIIIEMKDYLIVVDANYPGGAKGTMSDVKRISPKPVKYVFDTHHHGDHSYGNALWTQAGATTLAFQGVADEMQRFEPGRWQAAAKKRDDMAGMQSDGPEPPKQLIKEDRYVLNDGSRKVEFYHFGWGHTRGDGFVYIPKEQVLCTGDAVVNGPHNNFMDANIANWPETLRQAAKLKVKYVLPGHGQPGGRDLITGQADFLEAVYKAVKDGVDQGKTMEDIQASIHLPEDVGAWVGDSLIKRQVSDTYQEIKQGKPRGDLPH